MLSAGPSLLWRGVDEYWTGWQTVEGEHIIVQHMRSFFLFLFICLLIWGELFSAMLGMIPSSTLRDHFWWD